MSKQSDKDLRDAIIEALIPLGAQWVQVKTVVRIDNSKYKAIIDGFEQQLFSIEKLMREAANRLSNDNGS